MVTPCTLCPTLSRANEFTGRQRRLLYEWEEMKKTLSDDRDITVSVTGHDFAGIPNAYEVEYGIRSICAVREGDGSPVFADRFVMELKIPERYPQVDAPPLFRFVGEVRPWHPNIRYYGDMAGTVCINRLNTFTGLAWGVRRVAEYLRYERYHAVQEPPFPEDLTVAQWVRAKGERMGWIYFDQNI